MSALARYFMHEGRQVAGYDRTPSPLTRQLESEGASIHYEDDPQRIDAPFRDAASTLVVYTPAIPPDHREWAWLREHGFHIVKRSQALGHIAQGKTVMAVAGTHGKTTTTTLTAWLNHEAGGTDCKSAPAGEGSGNSDSNADERDGSSGFAARHPPLAGRTAPSEPYFGGSDGEGWGSAFLGGISKNFDSNLVLGRGPRLAVEADEFDRSFLQLHPDAAVVTSADADHLDIYGTHEAVKEAFAQFVRQIKPGGALIIKQGVDLGVDIEKINPQIRAYRYSYDQPCDFYARNITLLEGGYYRFDLVCPDMALEGSTLGIPGWVNVENAVAAVALVWTQGFDAAKLKSALARFKGVKRRFEFWINTPRLVYIDDYAHHPRELEAAITSIKRMFPGRRLTAVFQPHLYTRTRDFYREFAAALSKADRVVLLPIYPAREEPIEGINSEKIAQYLTAPHTVVPKERIAATLGAMDDLDVVVTFGAGDIERYCQQIAKELAGTPAAK